MSRKSTPLSQLLELLPPDQRAERYRQLAGEAFRKAMDAYASDQQAEYFSMAAAWHTLAMEIERAEMDTTAQIEIVEMENRPPKSH